MYASFSFILLDLLEKKSNARQVRVEQKPEMIGVEYFQQRLGFFRKITMNVKIFMSV